MKIVKIEEKDKDIVHIDNIFDFDKIKFGKDLRKNEDREFLMNYVSEQSGDFDHLGLIINGPDYNLAENFIKQYERFYKTVDITWYVIIKTLKRGFKKL